MNKKSTKHTTPKKTKKPPTREPSPDIPEDEEEEELSQAETEYLQLNVTADDVKTKKILYAKGALYCLYALTGTKKDEWTLAKLWLADGAKKDKLAYLNGVIPEPEARNIVNLDTKFIVDKS